LKFRAAHGGRACRNPDSRGLTSRFDLDKPIIAAVTASALGGGFELALAFVTLVVADGATRSLGLQK